MFKKLFISLALALFIFLIHTKASFAIAMTVMPIDRFGNAMDFDENTELLRLTIIGLADGEKFQIRVNGGAALGTYTATGSVIDIKVCGDGDHFKTSCDSQDFFHAIDYEVKVYHTPDVDTSDLVYTYTIPLRHYIPYINLSSGPTDKPTPATTLNVAVTEHRRPENNSNRNTYDIDIKGLYGTADPGDPPNFTVPPATASSSDTFKLSSGKYRLDVRYDNENFVLARFIVIIDADGGSITRISNSSASSGGTVGENPCIDADGDGKVDTCPTAIGNIPTNLGDFASAVLRIALGISGGIVLILMVIGSIRVMTSSGDPQRVAVGRDMIIAALTGALFIAFSVMIMQFLGTAVVPIPGLVFGT